MQCPCDECGCQVDEANARITELEALLRMLRDCVDPVWHQHIDAVLGTDG